ncbi:MAG: hypothetical protein M3N93_11025 [Acidobacteriota bacterium]|nr:hypothetical protein [Acidobacteriota bacterium]
MKTPRNIHLWLPGYLKTRAGQVFAGTPAPRNVWVMIADHYEPLMGGTDVKDALRRVGRWRAAWPEIAARHRDSAGQPPRYTFFYPQEEYRPELIDPLADMARLGVADVEIHLHHDGEGERDFVDRMAGFRDVLHHRHGMLRKTGGRISFAFIHGNWALDNSHPEGKFCGLNNEITLLKDLGCYADFTLPSAPNSAQTRIVNTIYWAVDDPARPKSHDTGLPVRAGQTSSGDLLMIPGPLGFRLREKGRLMPRIEMGEISGNDLPNRLRARVWLMVAPRVGENIYIKLHTHGAQDRNMGPLLEGGLDALFSAMETECAAAGLNLRYGTAREVYESVTACMEPRPATADAQ